MANTHMKRYWTRLVIREVQITTSVRCHHIITRMAKIKRLCHAWARMRSN